MGGDVCVGSRNFRYHCTVAYAVIFAVFGAYCAVMAFQYGHWAWLLLWPAVSFFVVSGAYAGLGPRVFGKKTDGGTTSVARLLLLPYLVFTYGVWHVQRLSSREACCQEIAPRLWLGRRPLRHEIPAGVTRIIDLTAEFHPARGVRDGRAYHCVPTLDAAPTPRHAFERLVEDLVDSPDCLYIHCAQGHGRSAALVGALLIRRGLAPDPEAAERIIVAARPGVRLSPSQRCLLVSVAG